MVHGLFDRSRFFGGFAALGVWLACSSGGSDETRLTSAGDAPSGALSIALSGTELAGSGDAEARLTYPDGHVERVTLSAEGEGGRVSAFFGALPVGPYAIDVRVGDCYGHSDFGVRAGATALVDVALSCPRREGVGAAAIEGTFEYTAAPCDHITAVRLDAAGNVVSVGASARIEAELNTDGATNTWSVEGAVEAPFETAGAAALSSAEGAVTTLSCTAPGVVYVVSRAHGAYDTRPELDAAVCEHSVRVRVECVSACGDGSLDRSEACDDGNVDPGDGCSAECGIEEPPTCLSCLQEFCGDLGEIYELSSRGVLSFDEFLSRDPDLEPTELAEAAFASPAAAEGVDLGLDEGSSALATRACGEFFPGDYAEDRTPFLSCFRENCEEVCRLEVPPPVVAAPAASSEPDLCIDVSFPTGRSFSGCGCRLQCLVPPWSNFCSCPTGC